MAAKISRRWVSAAVVVVDDADDADGACRCCTELEEKSRPDLPLIDALENFPSFAVADDKNEGSSPPFTTPFVSQSSPSHFKAAPAIPLEAEEAAADVEVGKDGLREFPPPSSLLE